MLAIKREEGRDLTGPLLVIAVAVTAIIVAFFLVRDSSRAKEYETADRLLREGKPELARARFAELAEISYRDSASQAKEAQVAVASAHLRNGLYSAAIQVVEPLARENWPGSKDILSSARSRVGIAQVIAEGDHYFKVKLYKAALEQFRKAEELATASGLNDMVATSRERQRDGALGLYKRGVEESRTGDPIMASYFLDSALEFDPSLALGGQARREAALGFYKRGVEESRTGDPVWASILLNSALKFDPSLAAARRALREVEPARKRQAAINAKLDAEKRKEYAEYMERESLSDGRDVRVQVMGPGNKTLKMTYVGFGRPEAYQMANDPDLRQKWSTLGFEKVILSDGYESSWSFRVRE